MVYCINFVQFQCILLTFAFVAFESWLQNDYVRSWQALLWQVNLLFVAQLALTVVSGKTHKYLNNCNIEFFTFRHCQVQNFEISNQSEQDQNFAVNFWKLQKWKQKLIKYIKIEVKCHEILSTFMKFCLLSWNFVYIHEILFTFMKFCWISLNFVEFH